MSSTQRSACPINMSLEILGDRWPLLILRDIVFAGRRYFRELLSQSDEGIASNVLADRLKRLVEEGVLTRAGDPEHKQKARYSLSESGIDLVPMLVQLGLWGQRHLNAAPELGAPARVLDAGGPAMWERFKAELRAEHLLPAGSKPEAGGQPLVRDEFLAAYQAAKAVPTA